MNIKIKQIFKNLTASVMANGINMVLSILLVLVVPKILGVKEYAYWQLYTFYTTYIGFFHFGIVDGIYLKYGGKKYDELDKPYFNRQFWILVIIEICVAAALIIGVRFVIADTDKQFILAMSGLCCVVYLPRVMLQYLLQATNRIVEFAQNQILEKVFYAVFITAALVFGVRDYQALILSDLLSKAITLALLVIICKDFIFLKLEKLFQGIREAIDNMSIGIKLLLSNIASMLITGIVRFAIENQWSVEVFGKLSLTMTASNLLMVFIGAVSIIVYPILRNVSREKMPQIYETLRCILMLLVLGLLLVYYPAKYLLSVWLPQYAESLRYMALLFPICVFESKMSMLVTTYLKALREEKMIMKINITVMALTLILTLIAAYFIGNLTLTIILLPLLMATRNILGEIALMKTLGVKVVKDIIYEVILAVVFIAASWNIQSFWCMVIYLFAYIVYVLLKRNDIKAALMQVKVFFVKERVS